MVGPFLFSICVLSLLYKLFSLKRKSIPFFERKIQLEKTKLLSTMGTHDVNPHFETMNTVGDRIRFCRQRLNLKQEELANLAGMSKGFLSEVETGNRNPSAEYLLRIANALGVSLDFLMKGGELPSFDPESKAVRIPSSLANFAHDKQLPFGQVRAILEAKLQLVANRRNSGEGDLEKFDWGKFYDAIKEYL